MLPPKKPKLLPKKPQPQKKQLGNAGEQLIKKRLLNKGWKFITQNYKIRTGEIDLIFQDKDCIVFIEVKARRNLDSGFPEEAITDKKKANIQNVAKMFLLENPQYLNLQPRIDAACIYRDNNKKFHYNYYTNITS